MNYSNKRKIYIVFSAVAVVFTMGVIFYLSAQNKEESAGTSNSLIGVIFSFFGKAPGQDALRTFAHFCEFAGLSFLVTNLFYAVKDKLNPVLCILLSWGYAWSDEIHQLFVPGRAFQLIDLTVDLCGIVLGTAVFSFFIIAVHKVQRRPYRKNK